MPDGERAGSGCPDGVWGRLITRWWFWMGRSGHPCPGDAQGLAAAAAHPLHPETSPAHSSTGQHSFASAEANQSIYFIIDTLLRATVPSEAPVCARDSETYVSAWCCTPGLTHLLLHQQLPLLQRPAPWVRSTLPSTHQKSEKKT